MRKLVFALAFLPLPAMAQSQDAQAQADKGYLTTLLEDNLSGAGRQVVIDGFEGALSSRARIRQLTIADDTGVWLTLRDVALDWNRAALLSGQVSVNELSAAEIILDRLPASGSSAPSPQASGSFALPELPVSIDIGALAANRIVLGPTVLGSAVEGRLTASVHLAGGQGKAHLDLRRTDDGPTGVVALDAEYANASQVLALDLSAQEGSGGIAATLLDLPGKPAAALSIAGRAPISDYSANIALSTDGENRLAGTVTVKTATDRSTGFEAILGGNLAPLFLPDYAEFFGDKVALDVAGRRFADGRLDLSKLVVAAKALQLAGTLAVGADGVPRSFDLRGRIAQADGQPVLLPLTTNLPVRIDNADLSLQFDATKGEGWTLSTQVTGLDRADMKIARLALAGSGRIANPAGSTTVGATLRFDAEGLAPSDPGLAAALGAQVSGDGVFYWSAATNALAFPKLTLAGDGYSASASGKVLGLSSDLALSGQIKAQVANLSRLSGLAGRPLGGAGQVTVGGNYSPLTGAFDGTAAVLGTDLSAGIAEVDGLLKGPSQVTLSARRDQTGTTLRNLTLRATSLTASAEGSISSAGTALTGDVNFADLSVLGPGYGGALTGKASVSGPSDKLALTLDATGSNLRTGQAEADKLLRGQSSVTVAATASAGKLVLDRADIRNPQLQAKASGVADGASQRLTIDANLANLGLLLPDFPGAMTVSGTVLQSAASLDVDLAGRGPGGINATVKGKVATDFRSANLALAGRAQAALANPFLTPRSIQGDLGFDMKLNGPLAVSSLSGTASLAGGRFSDPGFKFALQDIAARADISGGQARITGTVPVSTGGAISVSGTIGTAAPYAGNLALGLRGVVLRDPALYETRLNGDLTVKGPLAGGAMIAGRIALAETELRVPSTGFGGAAGLEGLRHIAEPADVRATRARAGQLGNGTAAGRSGDGPSYGLDVTLSAPNQLFVRGRGLDAELGGELRLNGTTAAVVPSGAFDLIRGRLDILGKRLDLTEARLQMEGELVPNIHIVASTENDGITTGIEIDGPATNPTVGFTSSPDLPDEEILAQLLFGQDLQSLSPFQALQLANAVATLAGKGGGGIVNKLRQGFGLDNLDVRTSATGGAEVTAGKYLGKNLYSEFSVDDQGKSQVNLNLDVSKSITAKARASSDGSTGIGIFLEKDY
ncbi:translocation/assembly module TamB domain-containing protein [Fuscibacter oryzae]|uniref:Translocation/assembly module TamB domain-containing protein n=1 Tax=Fuscibacter oryzae TaxID=2803939 RepID=A0A8J7MT53_9RHOB|nr:translocation/assembly module TamB domain-containing protein [Fuscibacter oryzae]MBL4929096.1 translocation/assembly module TamB domain-containing protein [Fuscibacter oryzae]